MSAEGRVEHQNEPKRPPLCGRLGSFWCSTRLLMSVKKCLVYRWKMCSAKALSVGEPRASRSVERLARYPKGETMFTNSYLRMIKLNDNDIQFINNTTSWFSLGNLRRYLCWCSVHSWHSLSIKKKALFIKWQRGITDNPNKLTEYLYSHTKKEESVRNF